MMSDKKTTALLIFIFVAASANYTSAAGFLIANVTTNSYTDSLFLIPGTADKSSVSIESGFVNIGFNVSIKIDDSQTKNITGINLTFPIGPFKYTQATLTTSNLSVQPGVSFTDTSNSVKIMIANSSSKYILTSGGGETAYFSFNLNAPSGTSKESSGNKSVYMRISAVDQDNILVEKDLTVYISDTTKPKALRYIQPTREASSYTKNTSADFSVAFNEPNAVSAILTIGFGNNGSIENKSMQIISSGLSGEARASMGLPEGRHNFSFSITDSENNKETNSSAYYIITDVTPPSLELKVPSSNVTKSSSVSSSDLTCSGTDSLSGASSPFSVIIEKPSGSKVTHTCGNTFSDTSEHGEYKVNFTLQDNAGNYASKIDVFRVSPSPQSSVPESTSTTQSSSPASTGNTTSSSNATRLNQTISRSLQIPDNLSKDNPAEIVIPKDLLDLGLTSLKITSKEDTNSTGQKIEVKALESIPPSDENNVSIPSLSSQKLIRAFQFILPGSLKEKVREANITFVLKREEMGDLSPAQIVVMRFSNGSWSELPTESKILDLKGNVQFTAVTPGFSVFVITTKSAAPENKALENVQPQAEQAAAPEAPGENSGSAATGKIISGVTDILPYALIIAVAAVLGVLIFRRKKSQAYEAAIQKEKKKDIKMYKSKLKKIRDS